ncbi:MAG: NCS2 family permease, partial [Treponema sp.]|nr:NCS2 family permease [Treponema sp.]
FKLQERKTNVRTEIFAGLTTFFTMAYIMFVNPNVLSETGMNWAGVFVATIIATVIGTLIMGLFANVPYAVAPGMGLNAFFTYTVCFGFGFKWQEALAMVFICGLINILITATKVRKSIIKAIPRSLQLAIGGGIGLFIAYIGVKNAGFIQFASTTDTLTLGSVAVPELIRFNSPGPILALIGLVIIVTLMLLKVRGALLIGIVAATLIGIPMGVTQIPDKLIDLSRLGGFTQVSFAFFGNPGLGSLFSRGAAMIPIVLITIFSFSLSDTFDTIGTFIGTGRKTGIFDEEDEKALYSSKGFKSRMDKALFADSTATSIGALFGTSNTTTYIESASGIGVGGRSGLTSVVVAVLFLLCLPFASLFGIVPSEATAPALIVVGVMMAEAFAEIHWKQLEEAIPTFFTVIIMTFAYNISYGIAAGFIFYCLAKLCQKEFKQVHPILIGATVLFILNFVLVAISGA